MTILLSSLYAQGAQAASDTSNAGSYLTGAIRVSPKVVLAGGATITALAVGVIGGGYYGAMGLGKMTENYYRRNGDPNKLGSLNIGLSVLLGGVGGALAGGCVAVAVSGVALGIL